MLKIYDNSKNYTCQVIKLPPKIPVKGLDNLVEVNVQGNSCLVGKDSDPNELYLFFPAECQISSEFLSKNSLYRHETLNQDPTKKGFFEDNGRVKAIKFKGVISSGFVIPISSLREVTTSRNGIGIITKHDEGYFNVSLLKVGDEFNEFHGIEICKKYIRKTNIKNGSGSQSTKGFKIEDLVDSRQAPEHMDTAHLMKNLHKLTPETQVYITYKLHGTSARTYNTLVKRKLTWKDKLAKFFGVKVLEQDYDTVVCSRRQVKSIGLEELPNKNHYYKDGDLWSEFAKKNLERKLNRGEAVYYEIIGKTYSGQEIQGGYSYGFNEPKGYIYRISNINSQGIEIDLPYDQMKVRASQLELEVCPLLFEGTIGSFINKYGPVWDAQTNQLLVNESLENIFYHRLLEKPSILDSHVVEEGFCIRVDKYPRPEIFKIKSKKFLEHESKAIDKELSNLEDEQTEGDN